MEAHVGITIAVLYADDEVTDDCHAGAVARELLIGHLRVVLLRLDEQMVEVQVVRLSGHKLASACQGLDQQAVWPGGRVEIVAFTCVGSVGRITRGQFRNASQDSVGAACAKSGVKGEMGHQVACHILHAVTAIEVNAR